MPDGRGFQEAGSSPEDEERKTWDGQQPEKTHDAEDNSRDGIAALFGHLRRPYLGKFARIPVVQDGRRRRQALDDGKNQRDDAELHKGLRPQRSQRSDANMKPGLDAVEDQHAKPDQHPGQEIEEGDDLQHENVNRIEDRPDEALLRQKFSRNEYRAAAL